MPVPLGFEASWSAVVAQETLDHFASFRYFVAERAKTARGFLKQLPIQVPIAQLQISELNEHTPPQSIADLLKPALDGHHIGLMSEAGCPAVADPGALLVAAAHAAHIEVIPAVGPSSILLALMSSGLSGQCFSFEGYLPAEKTARDLRLKELQKRSIQEKRTILWIETPYRAQAVFDAAIALLDSNISLSIAADLSLPNQFIKTRTIAQWKNSPAPLQKRLVVFAMGAG